MLFKLVAGRRLLILGGRTYIIRYQLGLSFMGPDDVKVGLSRGRALHAGNIGNTEYQADPRIFVAVRGDWRDCMTTSLPLAICGDLRESG